MFFLLKKKKGKKELEKFKNSFWDTVKKLKQEHLECFIWVEAFVLSFSVRKNVPQSNSGQTHATRREVGHEGCYKMAQSTSRRLFIEERF